MIPLVFAFFVFLITEILYTGWPKRVREFTIGLCESGGWGFWVARDSSLRRVKKPQYVIELRLIGIACLWAALLSVWTLFGVKHP